MNYLDSEQSGKILHNLKANYVKLKSSKPSRFYSQTDDLKKLLEIKSVDKINEINVNETRSNFKKLTLRVEAEDSKIMNSKTRANITKKSLTNTPDGETQNEKNKLNNLQDMLELYKSDILREIKNLTTNEETLQALEIQDELTSIKQNFLQSMKNMNSKSEAELEGIKDSFVKLREEVRSNLSEQTIQHTEILNSMAREVKDYKSEVGIRIDYLEKKQRAQMEGIKFLLNLSGVGDDKTKQLANNFLNEHSNEFDGDNYRNMYSKPTDKELSIARRDINKKTTRLFDIPNRGDDKEINSTYNLDEELKRKIQKTLKFNQKLGFEVNLKSLDKLKEKKEFSKSNKKRINKNIKVEEDEADFELSPINHFRKYVHMIMFINRLNKVLKYHKESTRLKSLKEFSEFFLTCDEVLKEFLSEILKPTLNSFFSFPNTRMDLLVNKLVNTFNESELKNQYIKLEVRLKSFFEVLMENTTVQKFPKEAVYFFKLILTSGNYIPFNFFTSFELSRLEIKDNILISNLKEKHFAMILCIYILCKIVIKYIFIELSFFPEEKRNSLNPIVLKNLKFFASVIFNEVLNIFDKQCPIINTIKDKYEFVDQQTIFDSGLEDENVLKFGPGANKNYKEAVRKYYKKKTKKRNGSDDVNQEKEIQHKLNENFNTKHTDNDIYTIEYIEILLFKYNDLDMYYYLSDKNEFDLSVNIFLWVKQLIKVIKAYQ